MYAYRRYPQRASSVESEGVLIHDKWRLRKDWPETPTAGPNGELTGERQVRKANDGWMGAQKT